MFPVKYELGFYIPESDIFQTDVASNRTERIQRCALSKVRLRLPFQVTSAMPFLLRVSSLVSSELKVYVFLRLLVEIDAL
jgi:hypothetical protein